MARLSSLEAVSRRVGRTVDVAVARHACTECDKLARQSRRRGGGRCLRRRRMPLLDVALLAEPGFGEEQHVFVVAAVGGMAIRAALHHGRMLPQEGAALVRVALEAGIVERVGLEKLLGHRPVGVVAARAVHLALADRHVRVGHLLGGLPQVTLPADLYDRGLGELTSRGDGLHDLVAVGAGEVPRLMGTSLPVEAGRLLMALKADGVPLGHREGRLLPKGLEPIQRLALGLAMGLPRPVAGLAAEAFLGGAGMLQEELVVNGLREGGGGILMAFYARLTSRVAGREFRGRLGLDRQGSHPLGKDENKEYDEGCREAALLPN